jgi:hypothetical protein
VLPRVKGLLKLGRERVSQDASLDSQCRAAQRPTGNTLCTPGMGVNSWGAGPLTENPVGVVRC